MTFSFLDYTRLKACQLADLAPTSSPSDRRKKSGVSVRSAIEFSFADFSGGVVMSRSRICASFYPTSRRNRNSKKKLNGEQQQRRTKTQNNGDVFIRNEECDSSPLSCGLYVEINPSNPSTLHPAHLERSASPWTSMVLMPMIANLGPM